MVRKEIYLNAVTQGQKLVIILVPQNGMLELNVMVSCYIIA